MLISFSVENWMSFRDKATFYMLATREQQHGERVAYLPKYRSRVLPVAALYGGNASGKTNLFTALAFAKHLVLEGTEPSASIPVDQFQMDRRFAKRPSRFSFEILVDENIYDFSFTITKNEVLEERLTEVLPTKERILYQRQGKNITFDNSFNGNRDFLQFTFMGTRPNQLFLKNSIDQNMEEFKTIYDFFYNKLSLIAPDTPYNLFEHFFQKNHPLSVKMDKILDRLDTGISHLGGEEVPVESLPKELTKELKEGETIRNHHHLITRKNGKITAQKLVAYHQTEKGPRVKFDISQESDGTKRLIDLIPAFIMASEPNTSYTFIIDEIDRSLHPLLIRQLLESYLESCSPDTRSQILFTTHNVMLMDQKLLRRDEMWFTERDAHGCSTLIPFSDYKEMRFDKDVRKSYLQGRLGGIPNLAFFGPLSDKRKNGAK